MRPKAEAPATTPAWRRARGRPVARTLHTAARFALCLGLVAALPLGGFAPAGASPLHGLYHSDHHGDHGDHGAPPGWGGPKWHPEGRTVRGTVGTVGTDSFQLALLPPGDNFAPPTSNNLTPTATTITVDVSASTVYREPTVKSASFSDVVTGDMVRVTGTPAGPGTIDALVVFIPAVQATGTVSTVSSGGFQLSVEARHGELPPVALTPTALTITVNVSASTIYREPTVKSPSLSNVVAGDRVRVSGAQDGANTINALSVFIPLATYAGTVGTVGSTGFTLSTAKGATITVNVSSTTQFRGAGPGSTVPAPGDQVRVIGTQAGTATVDALWVLVNANPVGGHHGGRGDDHGPGHLGRR